MPTDTTTFVLAFGATFALLGWYMWRLERTARRLEATVAAAAAAAEAAAHAGTSDPTSGATKPKNSALPGNKL